MHPGSVSDAATSAAEWPRVKRMRSPTAPAPRSRSLTRCTLTGPIPVSTERSGAWPCRTTRSRPSGSCTPFIRARNASASASMACESSRRSAAPQNRRQRIVYHLGLSEGNNRAILCHGVSLLREVQAGFHPPRYAAFLTSPSPSFGYSSQLRPERRKSINHESEKRHEGGHTQRHPECPDGRSGADPQDTQARSPGRGRPSLDPETRPTTTAAW